MAPARACPVTDATIWGAVLVGAAGILVNLILLITAVVFIVNAHERRELARDQERDRAMKEAVGDLKKLTLLAIAGRSTLEQKVTDSEKRHEEHSGRLEELRMRLDAIDGKG